MTFYENGIKTYRNILDFREAHIITSNYLQLFYSLQPTKLLLAA